MRGGLQRDGWTCMRACRTTIQAYEQVPSMLRLVHFTVTLAAIEVERRPNRVVAARPHFIIALGRLTH